MILPQTEVQTLILMVISLVCLSSWAVTLKLTGKWRFELFYIDFAFGAVIAMTVYALTLGSMGFDGFTLVDDVVHAGGRQLLMVFVAGVVFNLGNILLTAAISVAGMSVVYPLAAGLGLMLGAGLRTMIRQEGDPLFLFLGFVFILISMAIAGLVHSHQTTLKAQAILLAAQQSKKRVTQGPRALKGILLSIASGIFLAGYLPLLNRGRVPEIGLGPYAAAFVLTAGVFASTLVYVVFFANLPVEGEPIEIPAYLRGTPKSHVFGLLGGVLWCTGMLGAMIGSAADVPSIGNAAPWFTFGVPLLGTFWGVVVWQELPKSASRTRTMSYVMLLVLAVGIALVSLAPHFIRKV